MGLFYKGKLFDPNRDAMIGYLISEAAAPPDVAADMVARAWDTWTARLRDQHGMTEERAGRGIDAAIGYLHFLGRDTDPDSSYGPAATGPVDPEFWPAATEVTAGIPGRRHASFPAR